MRMPFGKFKGYELSELSDSYFYWLWSLEDLNLALRHGVQEEYARRNERPSSFDKPPVRVEDIIKTGFRTLAKQCHPDAGGTDKAMREVIDAMNWLKEKLLTGGRV